MTNAPSRVRLTSTKLLSDDWGVLKKNTFDFLRSDGTWQQQTRETYDRGHGATVLLYNLTSRTVVLIRQFRFPVYQMDPRTEGLLIETPAGLLDDADPAERIRAEIEEETGYHVHDVTRLFEAYTSPGSVTEKLYFFAAEYDIDARKSAGGGLAHEGEDIEVLELPFDEALAMIRNGEIQDGKTIMLLHYAALYLFPQR
ncbi:nudix-type nucleoside diphosphatase (YffH/AdpP family) [Pseudomonas duriflava]|uniref:GDP-mannose pyrophosphatase n=1 Tax=Pseudomonas duriflava TaxID=459528 RepID=A0A562QNL3_9PSED|nr:NUDIX domain-containing protein [Pseudomonas duriflava]TWI58342.1 nudix-type nucleoside diphosphatase (YffH/AdpP family) [Pseudomonas duriflava]